MKKKAAVEVSVSNKGKLGSLLGHSVISVMRAAGKHGWTPAELKAALEAQVGKTVVVMPAEDTIKLAI